MFPASVVPFSFNGFKDQKGHDTNEGWFIIKPE